MDRFIELKATRQLLTRKLLKSNMDRFIALDDAIVNSSERF